MSQKVEPVVFIVDDDDAVRGALELLLKSVQLKAESFASAAEFLDRFDPEDAGCVLLDIRMAGMSGLELYEELRRQHAIIPIIFITGHGDVDMAVQAMKDGAADFIQKPFHDQTLLDRIQKSLDMDAGNRKLLAQKQRISDNIKQLTPRETEVMDLIVDGKPNKVVAHDLGISERTVEIHRARVMKKLGATSLAHLVRMAIRARR